MQTYIYGHGPFLGNTGYNVHTRNFFTSLNKYFPIKVRNVTTGNTVLTKEQQHLLGSFSIKPDINLLNIVLAETYNTSYINDQYEGFKILYNVWESTEQPIEFFNKSLKFDQFWVPSEWQKECAIKQGYTKDKIFVVHEGVADYFKPNLNVINTDDIFKFVLVGKWEYRKSTEEIIKCFLHTFRNNDKVKLLLLVDNPFSPLCTVDNLLNAGINPEDSHLQIVDYVNDEEYLNILQTVDAFVSCSRSEGWNLPLLEAMAVGLPSVCSNCSGQMEFAKYGAITVDILKEKSASFNVSKFPGNYYEPNFNNFNDIILDIYNNYELYKNKALKTSDIIREEFSWDKSAIQAKNIIDNFNFSSYTKKRNAKVVTVATDINKGLELLKDSCNKHTINLEIIGSNKKWTDFYMKIDEMYEYLKKLKDDDILLFVDGYDSYIVDDFNSIIDKFIKLDCKILISSEVGCFPDASLQHNYLNTNSKFKFLNSGGYIGYVVDIKKAITALRMLRQNTNSVHKDNDQYLWSLYYLENLDIIKLDTKCEIFQCLHSTTVNDFELIGTRYKNKMTDTYPSIYHANGNSNEVLFELIYDNPNIKIYDITLIFENDQPRFDFSYNGPNRIFTCDIKNYESNEIYHSTNINLENNNRYFIKANKDISDDVMLTLEVFNGRRKFSENFLINKIKNCAFITTWFGKLPYWFDYFMKSCKLNPDFDFLIFTDQIIDFEHPNNIIFRYMDLDKFNLLINKKLHTEFKVDNSYKLCDFKAMYGYLYNEYITAYKYWGFCDIDIVWGNLNTFFKSYISKGSDVITLGASTKELHYRIAGPCTLVKNSSITNLSFYKVLKYKDVFKTQEYINFEESEWDNWLKNQSDIKFDILLENQGWENNIPIDTVEWINGSLYLPSGKEIAMYHFRDKNKIFSNVEGGFKIMIKQNDLISDKASVKNTFINPKRTICEVHREIYRKIKGTNLEDNISPLVEESFTMAKKMNNKLRQYKNNYDNDWWESNKLSGEKLYNRKVFIDGGAHFGESLELFKKKYIDHGEYVVYMFEPVPDFIDKLKLNKDKNVTIYNKALWVEDTELDFYKGWDLSGSLIKSKTSGNLDKDNPIKIKAIDFSSWIINTFNKDDHIVLKLDIEGAEYSVLEKMIETGAINYINTLYIEFHYDRITEITESDHYELISRLNSVGINPLFWDGERGIVEKEDLVYITGGDISYMPLIKVLVESIDVFSKYKIIVYGYNCIVPFDNDKMIKKTISIDNNTNLMKYDGRSMSYSMAKEMCCIDVIEKNYASNYVWIDGDSFVSKTIDNVIEYSKKIIDYPLINSHIHDTIWDNNDLKCPIGYELMNDLGIERKHYPWLHACFFIFNNRCKQFFELVLTNYKEIDKKYFSIITDELIFNILAEYEEFFRNMHVHDFDVHKEESFQKFLKGDYVDAYITFTQLLGDSLSDHIVLPSTEDDIYIFHGQKSPNVLRGMFNEYKLNIEGPSDSYFYVPHSDDIVDLKIDNSLLNYTYKEIFENKDYYYEDCNIKEGDVVVDCGANVGIFTRYAYKMGASRVLSFEPEPNNYRCLTKNILNSSELYNTAVSNKESTKVLYLDQNAGGHSVIKEDINNTKSGDFVEVECLTLNSLFNNKIISKIDFLKVDVEGAELEVFDGLIDFNLLKINKISIEYHHAKFNFDEDVRNKFLERFTDLGFKYHILFLGNNKHLQMIYLWRDTCVKIENTPEYIVNHNFIDGPFCEIKGNNSFTYNIDFIDKINGQIVYSKSNLLSNHWVKANRKWFTDWNIKIVNNKTNISHDIDYNPIDKRVYIAIDSKSLGDTIAWFPYTEEFRKKWGCKMVVSTFWNNLFEDQYPDIEFIKPGTVANDLYAMYSIGWYSVQDYKNPRYFLDIPMQQTASDILGLDYEVIKPKISIPKTTPSKEKYVCIGIHTTCQAKYWNNKNGWQKVVDYLNNVGYKVYSISKEPNGYMGNYLPKGVIDKSGDIPIVDRIACLANAEFFIGVGSGLSWLAWAVGIPVVMISGFSSAITEFPADIRIEAGSTCKNCFNKYRLNPSNWMWCPENKKFECTSSILPEYVIDKISNRFVQ